MNTIFKKENLKKTLLTLIYLVLGVMFCVMPVRVFNFTESCLCFILLGAGILLVLIYSIMSSEDKDFKMMLYGILALILGLFMVLVPRLFGILLSIFIALSGVDLIVSGAKLKKQKNRAWITDLIIGIVIVALSITTIVLSGTSAAKKIIAIFFAIVLLVNGIYGLLSMIVLAVKSKKKPVEDKIDPDTAENYESKQIVKQDKKIHPQTQKETKDEEK